MQENIASNIMKVLNNIILLSRIPSDSRELLSSISIDSNQLTVTPLQKQLTVQSFEYVAADNASGSIVEQDNSYLVDIKLHSQDLIPDTAQAIEAGRLRCSALKSILPTDPSLLSVLLYFSREEQVSSIAIKSPSPMRILLNNQMLNTLFSNSVLPFNNLIQSQDLTFFIYDSDNKICLIDTSMAISQGDTMSCVESALLIIDKGKWETLKSLIDEVSAAINTTSLESLIAETQAKSTISLEQKCTELREKNEDIQQASADMEMEIARQAEIEAELARQTAEMEIARQAEAEAEAELARQKNIERLQFEIASQTSQIEELNTSITKIQAELDTLAVAELERLAMQSPDVIAADKQHLEALDRLKNTQEKLIKEYYVSGNFSYKRYEEFESEIAKLRDELEQAVDSYLAIRDQQIAKVTKLEHFDKHKALIDKIIERDKLQTILNNNIAMKETL
jgi:hypothetical protein